MGAEQMGGADGPFLVAEVVDGLETVFVMALKREGGGLAVEACADGITREQLAYVLRVYANQVEAGAAFTVPERNDGR